MQHRTNNLQLVLDSIDHLKFDERNYLLDILFKRYIEQRRESIKKRSNEAEKNYKQGKANVGSLKDFWKNMNA